MVGIKYTVVLFFCLIGLQLLGQAGTYIMCPPVSYNRDPASCGCHSTCNPLSHPDDGNTPLCEPVASGSCISLLGTASFGTTISIPNGSYAEFAIYAYACAGSAPAASGGSGTYFEGTDQILVNGDGSFIGAWPSSFGTDPNGASVCYAAATPGIDVPVDVSVNRKDECVRMEVTISSGTPPVGCTILKANLEAFDVKSTQDKTVALNWITVSELNHDYFAIERSQDGIIYAEIGRVAGAGNSEAKNDYSYVDERPFQGSNYYRLKQVDFSGQVQYSKVKVVHFQGQGAGAIVYPTVARDFITIRFPKTLEKNTKYTIINTLGQVVGQGELEAEYSEYPIETSQLSVGEYVVFLQSSHGLSEGMRFMKY